MTYNLEKLVPLIIIVGVIAAAVGGIKGCIAKDKPVPVAESSVQSETE
jgi:hypothetical protein